MLAIDVRANETVTLLDRENRSVITRAGGVTGRVPYDKLIIATGSAPTRPPIPGAAAGALPDVYVLRSVADSDAIKARVDALLKRHRAPRAVVLGAGFIGLEVAEQLTRRGISVAVVEARTSVLAGAMDADMAQVLGGECESVHARVTHATCVCPGRQPRRTCAKAVSACTSVSVLWPSRKTCRGNGMTTWAQ